MVDQLSASPLFFAVSRVVPYENPFGWRRLFQFDDSMAETWSRATTNGTAHVSLHSGQPYFSDQLFDQQLSSASGVRENILELPERAADELKEWCGRYHDAGIKFDLCFGATWIIVLIVSVAGTVAADIALIIAAATVAALVGSRPAVSIGDKTENLSFLSPTHLHVYSYYPGDDNTAAHYYCVCGVVRKAEDDVPDESPS